MVNLRLLGVFVCLFSLVCGSEDSSGSSDLPVISDKFPSAYLTEQFTTAESDSSWIRSNARKPDENDEIAQYDGKWSVERAHKSLFSNDLSLVMKSKARHHAIARSLRTDFDFTRESSLIVQYEVKFAGEAAHDCGGAYVKLLSVSPDPLDSFNNTTPYTVMFGPDKCGHQHSLHMIVRFKNPLTGSVSEHHAENASSLPDNVFTDGLTHLYRLRIDRNDDFVTWVDNEKVQSGNLKTNLAPAVVPDELIDDETDVKPEDWDDNEGGRSGGGKQEAHEEEIPDETATKPDDWDENAPPQILDTKDKKPEDWLEDEPVLVPDNSVSPPEDYDPEIDGEWEAPLIPNPKCEGRSGCGEWKARMIENPAYRGKWTAPYKTNPNYAGEWKPRKVANPAYFALTGSIFESLAPIGALGLELWTLSSDVAFDNFVVVSAKDETIPRRFAEEVWKVKYEAEKASKASSVASTASSIVEKVTDYAGNKPWMAAGVVVSVFVVIITIISFMRTGKKSAPRVEEPVVEQTKDDGSDEDELAEKKKSDEEEVEEVEEVEEDEEAKDGPVKRSKARIEH